MAHNSSESWTASYSRRRGHFLQGTTHHTCSTSFAALALTICIVPRVSLVCDSGFVISSNPIAGKTFAPEGGSQVTESSLTEHLVNVDAADAFERQRQREMDEKFCERLAWAIARGQERMPGPAK